MTTQSIDSLEEKFNFNGFLKDRQIAFSMLDLKIQKIILSMLSKSEETQDLAKVDHILDIAASCSVNKLQEIVDLFFSTVLSEKGDTEIDPEFIVEKVDSFTLETLREIVNQFSDCLQSETKSISTLNPTSITASSGVVISVSNLLNSVCNGLFSFVGELGRKLSLQPEIDKFDREIEQQIEQLIPKIDEVESRIQNFDSFIRERHDLASQCQEYFQKEKELIAIISEGVSFKSEKLNPNNLIDHRTLLLQELNRLNYAWGERIHFLRRHHILAQKMVEYMKEKGYGQAVNFLEYVEG